MRVYACWLGVSHLPTLALPQINIQSFARAPSSSSSRYPYPQNTRIHIYAYMEHFEMSFFLSFRSSSSGKSYTVNSSRATTAQWNWTAMNSHAISLPPPPVYYNIRIFVSEGTGNDEDDEPKTHWNAKVYCDFIYIFERSVAFCAAWDKFYKLFFFVNIKISSIGKTLTKQEPINYRSKKSRNERITYIIWFWIVFNFTHYIKHVLNLLVKLFKSWLDYKVEFG